MNKVFKHLQTKKSGLRSRPVSVGGCGLRRNSGLGVRCGLEDVRGLGRRRVQEGAGAGGRAVLPFRRIQPECQLPGVQLHDEGTQRTY